MNSPAAFVPLHEVDAELTLIGSVFMAPEAFDLVAGAIRPEWISEPMVRYLWEAALRISEAGNKLSPPAVMAALPEQCGELTRGQLFAKACSAAVPVSMLGGVIATVKDRWARRTIDEMADNAKLMAVRFDADPYDVASDCIMSLDAVSAVKAAQAGMSIADATDQLFDEMTNDNKRQGATTGLRALDLVFNGYKSGQLVVIGGRPGMGKSAFMCSSLRRTAASGIGVGIFSFEMTAPELAARFIVDNCDTTSAPAFGDLQRGKFKPEQHEMLATSKRSLDELKPFLHIDESARLTFAEIAGRARKLKAQMNADGVKLGVICIDHMGLVTPSERYAGNKVAEASEVSGRARALAKELDCCVILLCQLSRDVEKREDKRPVMSDLRWSGEIEQDAHVIVFLYREAYYLGNDPAADPYKLQDARWSIEALVRKNRNGETADIRLWCSIAHSSIRDLQ